MTQSEVPDQLIELTDTLYEYDEKNDEGTLCTVDRFEEVMAREHQQLFIENLNKGGIYLEMVDFNDLFMKLSISPVIINHFDVSTAEDRERLNNLLFTRYEGDTLDVLPSCECGELRGEFNVSHEEDDDYKIVCPNCNTTVSAVTERTLESTLWITTPKGVKALIHPLVWAILSKVMTKSGFNMLEWLVNSSYKPPYHNDTINKLQSLGFQRSLNYFYENFDTIMEQLFRYRLIKTTGKGREELKEFIRRERHKIFCQYIPIPSKLGFVTESTAGATYVDTTMAPAIDAVRTISSIESSITPATQVIRERRVVKAINQLSKYFYSFTGAVGTKPGMFRQQVFGGRPHFSGRAVISSIYDEHRHDECILPWGLAVMMLKIHIANKLLKRGFTPNGINKYIFEHVKQYSDILAEIFQELIDEGKVHGERSGIRILLHRNPSLDRLSAQALYVREIRSDVRINTIGISTKILVAPNADFDGKFVAVV